MLPAALVLLVLVNFWTGNVYWRVKGGGRDTSLITKTDRWTFWGTILMKLGIGASCFIWYVIANDDSREHLAPPIVAGSVFLSIAGLIMVTAGFMGY